MTFPSNDNFGAFRQGNTGYNPASERNQSGGQVSNPAADIQAWLQYAFTQQNIPVVNVTATTADRNVSEKPAQANVIQPTNGLSLEELQGRLQLNGANGKQKVKAPQNNQNPGDRQKQVIEEVIKNRNAAQQKKMMGDTPGAIGHLKTAFSVIVSRLKELQQEKQDQKVASASGEERMLKTLMHDVTKETVGVMQEAGITIQPNDAQNLLMDGAMKKAGVTGLAQVMPTNQGQSTRLRMNEKVQSLLQTLENNPRQAEPTIKAINAIQALLSDSSGSTGDNGYAAQRIQQIQAENTRKNSQGNNRSQEL